MVRTGFHVLCTLVGILGTFVLDNHAFSFEYINRVYWKGTFLSSQSEELSNDSTLHDAQAVCQLKNMDKLYAISDCKDGRLLTGCLKFDFDNEVRSSVYVMSCSRGESCHTRSDDSALRGQCAASNR